MGVPAAGAAYMLAHDPQTRGARVFERECASCHSLDGRGPEKPKGGLRLTSRAAVLRGGDTGPAAVAGKPDGSLLL